ncbi:MAG TPA: anti-sigma factor [Tepidisphaeraceae bacterium]
MTRDDLDELMLLYAAGVAEDHERDAAESLLGAGDLSAQSSHAEAQAVLAAMPLSLQQVEAPRAVRDKLLFRIAADTQHAGSTVASPAIRGSSAARHRSHWPTYLSTGIAAALAIALTLTWTENRRISGNWAKSQRVIETTRTVMSSSRVSLAQLSDAKTPTTYGNVLYCPLSRQYQVAVFHLRPPADGRTYELWLITADGKKIPAGTFDVDSFGRGMISANAPHGVDIGQAAITDEPIGGSEQPTGAIHLAGELQTR